MNYIKFENTLCLSLGHKVLQDDSEAEPHECRNLHGHDFFITLQFICEDKLVSESKYKVIAEYLKKHWKNKMLIYDRDPIGMKLSDLDSTIVFVPFNPTVDNIAEYIVVKLGTSLLRDTNYTITKCTVRQGKDLNATYTII